MQSRANFSLAPNPWFLGKEQGMARNLSFPRDCRQLQAFRSGSLKRNSHSNKQGSEQGCHFLYQGRRALLITPPRGYRLERVSCQHYRWPFVPGRDGCRTFYRRRDASARTISSSSLMGNANALTAAPAGGHRFHKDPQVFWQRRMAKLTAASPRVSIGGAQDHLVPTLDHGSDLKSLWLDMLRRTATSLVTLLQQHRWHNSNSINTNWIVT